MKRIGTKNRFETEAKGIGSAITFDSGFVDISRVMQILMLPSKR